MAGLFAGRTVSILDHARKWVQLIVYNIYCSATGTSAFATEPASASAAAEPLAAQPAAAQTAASKPTAQSAADAAAAKPSAAETTASRGLGILWRSIYVWSHGDVDAKLSMFEWGYYYRMVWQIWFLSGHVWSVLQ